MNATRAAELLNLAVVASALVLRGTPELVGNDKKERDWKTGEP
jgi:hypothetical protein